jgi:Histidine kinase
MDRGIEGRARAWIARHVVLTDLVVAMALAGLALGPAAHSRIGSPWWLIAAVACFLPLTWRRHRPVPAAVGVAIVALVIFAAGQRLLVGPAFVALWVAVYSVAALEPRRPALAAAAALEALGVATVVRWAPGNVIAAGIVLTTGTAAAAVVIGSTGRHGAPTWRPWKSALPGWSMSAISRPGSRPPTSETGSPREVHDIVTHSLSVMVALADGAAAASSASPERAGAAMRQVAATGRHAGAGRRLRRQHHRRAAAGRRMAGTRTAERR